MSVASSDCSSSTMASLSPEARARRRAIRERELQKSFARHNLPGFNVPGPGQYDTARSSFKADFTPGAWSSDELTQHLILDNTGHSIEYGSAKPGRWDDLGRDPGRYALHLHEVQNEHPRRNVNGVYMDSPIPQRPIARNNRGQPATLKWQLQAPPPGLGLGSAIHFNTATPLGGSPSGPQRM